jgi:hypothetical protein
MNSRPIRFGGLPIGRSSPPIVIPYYRVVRAGRVRPIRPDMERPLSFYLISRARMPIATAFARLLAPSFAKMFRMWDLTVSSVT